MYTTCRNVYICLQSIDEQQSCGIIWAFLVPTNEQLSNCCGSIGSRDKWLWGSKRQILLPSYSAVTSGTWMEMFIQNFCVWNNKKKWKSY